MSTYVFPKEHICSCPQTCKEVWVLNIIRIHCLPGSAKGFRAGRLEDHADHCSQTSLGRRISWAACCRHQSLLQRTRIQGAGGFCVGIPEATCLWATQKLISSKLLISQVRKPARGPVQSKTASILHLQGASLPSEWGPHPTWTKGERCFSLHNPSSHEELSKNKTRLLKKENKMSRHSVSVL